MRDWTFDRAAALGGIGFAVLAGVASAIAPTTMKLDIGATELRSKLAGHADGIGTGALLTAIGTISFGCFLAYVHRRLETVERSGSTLGSCFVIAGTALVTIGLIGAALQALVAHHAAGLDDSTLLLAFRLWQVVSYELSAIPAAVVMLAVGVRSWQTGVFPRWLGALAIVAAVAGVVAVGTLYATGDNAPAVIDAGGFLLATVWMVATGIVSLLPARALPQAQFA